MTYSPAISKQTSCNRPTAQNMGHAAASANLTDANTSAHLTEDTLSQIAQSLPPNDLALFGGSPVRSQPYPSWPISDSRDISALSAVVQSGRWGGAPYPGPKTQQFAQQFTAMQAGSTSSYQAVPMANGSLTMEVALRTLDIGWGDEVIVPAYTFQATAAAVIAAGAVPVLVEIDAQTYCISPEAINAAITPKTKAVIPVHLGAQIADMDAIMAIAHRHNLFVIEDCAHATGAQWNEQGVGTFGHFGSFSLQSNKILTTGEGGVLLCRDAALSEKAASIINCGRKPTSQQENSLSAQLAQFIKLQGQEETVSMGINYRMSEFQAALGTVALERFGKQVEERENSLNALEKKIKHIPGVRLLKRDRRHTKRAFYRYIFALVPSEFGATHDEVCFALQAEGIPAHQGYPPLHRCTLFQPLNSQLPVPSAYPEKFDFSNLHLPETERACQTEAIWLDERIFRAGEQGIEDCASAIEKVQRQAAILSEAKAKFLKRCVYA